MLCREVERLLPEYADDALREAQANEISEHLQDCAACREELASLETALNALTSVAREPAPDLWFQFQTRLQQEQSAADCQHVSALLPSYAEGELALADDRLVRQHVAACGDCAAREQELTRPMRALQAAATGASVDLWPAFTGRLAGAVTCAEVDEALPAYLAGERDTRSIALSLHLSECAACAASLAAYEAASGALARVASAQPEVDLWPAFERRLQAERARRPVWSNLLAPLSAMAAWLRGPLLQPAIGLAAFVLVTVLGQQLPGILARQARTAQTPRVTAPTSGTRVTKSTAAPEAPVVKQVAPAPPAPLAADPVIASASSIATPAPAPVKVASSAGKVVEGQDPSVPPVDRLAGVRVAFNLPHTENADATLLPDRPFDLGADSTAVSCEQEGMAAVVQAVELLAGSEDALHSPFETNSNEK